MLPVKKKIRALLEDRKPNEVKGISLSDSRTVRTLISLSYDKKHRTAWRAIETIGRLSSETAEQDPEAVRNLVGRLLWMIRDESGGIGWSCPEILGEIVRNNPDRFSDVAPVIASFHEEKMLTAGVIWAMARVGRINRETVEYAVPIILPYLRSDDNTLRGYAAYALGEMHAQEALQELGALKTDDSEVDFYEEGELTKKTVGELSSEAADKIRMA